MIFESVPDATILTLDSEGRVSASNPGAERLLGFAEAEILGCRLDAMRAPRDRGAK